MPKNKKQHYVPQFYLKLFSSDKKTIFCYNLGIQKSFRIPIKDVCYEPYYYDTDNDIEKAISNLEGLNSQIIDTIIRNNDIKNLNLKQILDLLHFISLQRGRTKRAGDANVEVANKFFNKIKPKELDNVKLNNKHPALDTMLNSLLSAPLILDLKPLLIINESKRDFITSDNPTLFFNSFFNDKVDGGTVGFAQKGLQIFYPLNSKLLFLLYDSNYYKVNNDNSSFLKIKREEDVRRINGLQILHCNHNIFHQNETMFDDIKLQHRQIGFKRLEDKVELKTVGRRKEEGKNYELIRLSSTKPKYNLDKLSFMKHKKNAPQEIGFRNEKFLKDHNDFLDDFMKSKMEELKSKKEVKSE